MPDCCAFLIHSVIRAESVPRTALRKSCAIATASAPEAVQVADRFHLLVNLSEAVLRSLEPRYAELVTGTSAQRVEGRSLQPRRIQTRAEHSRRSAGSNDASVGSKRYEKVAEMNRAVSVRVPSQTHWALTDVRCAAGFAPNPVIRRGERGAVGPQTSLG